LSKSQTAVAFGIKGAAVAMSISPLRFARPSGEAPDHR
jgi:hypothetical protein